VVRRADTAISDIAPTSGWFNLQVSGCAGDVVPYVLDLDTNPGAFTLHANSSPGCIPLATAPIANITPFYVQIYFVSTCSGTDCSAAGANSIPTLKRIDVTPAGTALTPIVDGVENLQFDFGVDATLPMNGAPDSYEHTPLTMTQWQNVMSVRVHLLARNLDATAGYSDPKTYQLGPEVVVPASGDASYKRHAYSELVRLNNPSGRRE
jgi:type IV pilus assembly protein PilW